MENFLQNRNVAFLDILGFKKLLKSEKFILQKIGDVYQDAINNDGIISVGYRAHSKLGTEFRQWATSVLQVYF